jgi:hypothetical protein
MSSQVRKNVTNPHYNLFHHGLIKLLVISELKKQGRTWEDFLYQFMNPHLTIKMTKKSIDPGTASPSNPHSPKTPNPPIKPLPSSATKVENPIVDLSYLHLLLTLNRRNYRTLFTMIFLQFLQGGEVLTESKGNHFVGAL